MLPQTLIGIFYSSCPWLSIARFSLESTIMNDSVSRIVPCSFQVKVKGKIIDFTIDSLQQKYQMLLSIGALTATQARGVHWATGEERKGEN